MVLVEERELLTLFKSSFACRGFSAANMADENMMQHRIMLPKLL